MYPRELSGKFEKYLSSVFNLCESPIEQQFLNIVVDMFLESYIANYDVLGTLSLKFLSKCINNNKPYDSSSNYTIWNGQRVKIHGIQISTIETTHVENSFFNIDGDEFNIDDVVNPKYRANQNKNFYNKITRNETIIGILEIYPQFEIREYRIDFAFVLKKFHDNEWHKISKYAIECDGFDYHHTKEQIANDNRRLRDLTTEGFTVVKFSGSDIYKVNPVKDFITKMMLKMRGNE